MAGGSRRASFASARSSVLSYCATGKRLLLLIARWHVCWFRHDLRNLHHLPTALRHVCIAITASSSNHLKFRPRWVFGSSKGAGKRLLSLIMIICHGKQQFSRISPCLLFSELFKSLSFPLCYGQDSIIVFDFVPVIFRIFVYHGAS